jgi:hypothetical protein
MSLAKQSLLKALAGLASRHSATDWTLAADSLEEIASLARAIAELDETKKIKNKPARQNRKSSSNKKQKSATNKLGGRLWPDAKFIVSKIPISRLREAAVVAGMKNEIAKTKDGIVDQICDHLTGLDSNLMLERIIKLNATIGDNQDSQQESYDKWVKLITRKSETS